MKTQRFEKLFGIPLYRFAQLLENIFVLSSYFVHSTMMDKLENII